MFVYLLLSSVIMMCVVGDFSSGSGSALAPESPPEDIMVTNITATSVTLSWAPPVIPNGNITSYNITYQPLDGSKEPAVEGVSGDTSNIMLSDLCPFTNYTVSVFASTAEGPGPAGNVSFTTKPAAPPPPYIVEAFPISSTALLLRWQLEEDVPGTLSGYQVTYNSVGTQVKGNISLGPNETTVVVRGLEVWSEYEVCVNASTEEGGQGAGNCTFLRTLPAEPTLHLVLNDIAPYCVVTWESVTSDELPELNGPEDDAMYIVVWQEVEGEAPRSNTSSFPFDITTNFTVLPRLMLGTEYTVTVAVSNSNGTGPPSNKTIIRTPEVEELQVRMLHAVHSSTSLGLSWDTPSLSPPLPSYNYTITVPSRGPLLTDQLSLNLTGLSPNTDYTISVTTSGVCGQGEPVIQTFTTQVAPPIITIVTVSASTVVVRWEKPSGNSTITGYKVKCGDGGIKSISASDNYYTCEGLAPDTPLSVSVWAVNTAGDGEKATVATSTACEGKAPDVDVEGGIVSVTVDKGCPGEDHVLVVVQEVGSDKPRPLSSYTIRELMELTRDYAARQRPTRQATQTAVYIAANITDSDFPFQLGDGKNYGGYTNYPLDPGTEYIVGVLSIPGDMDEPAVFTDSQFMTPDEEEEEDGSDFPLFFVVIAGGSVATILFVVLCVAITTFICCHCKKSKTIKLDTQRKGTTQVIERSNSVRISGRRGNKLTDPVEEYRTNYHTEALEAHPPVPIDGFINKLLVMRTNDNQLFLEEFGSIDMNPQQPCSVAELPANRTKNRYHNILPYDHSRVKLSHSKGQSDYINGSYCSGFMKVQGFLATQGPLPETISDFWRMVWEQNSRTIVMLTNAQERLKTKCEVYWPREVGCSTVYGNIEVTLIDFTQLADYTVRSLTLNKVGSAKEVREVRQFHFTSWPDHGVPQFATAMLSMVRRVQAFHTVECGPMVVHCSAGVGRTGTFIVIYSMMERMRANRHTVDIYGHVSLLRTQRNYMVQTEDQYFFIYEAVAEVIVCGDTEVPIEQLEDYVGNILSVANEHSDHTNIELQFKRLAVDKSDAYRFASANKDVNKAKNRYVNVLPYENRRVILQYQRAQEGSDYINASFIDGYHYRNAFIATQGPLQNTLADFWRMVWEHNVPVIVMLTKCQEKGTERSAQYWPQDIGQSLSCGVYCVEMTVERKSEHYTYRDLVLVDTQSGRKRQVRHFHYLSWPEVGVPSSSVVLLDFLREIQKNFATLNTKSPITVHCSNGIGRSGIFITLHIVLERMVAEGLVDVFQTIKNLRIQRPAMVQTLEQYQFCYTAALDYLESSDLVNQLKSSTRSDTHSLRHSSNASDLRASRRSLNRNDSLRSSVKRSSRNLEMSQVGNGVTTTVYGGSEATSTFGTSHPVATLLDDSPSQGALQGVADLGDGSGTPVPPLHPSLLPPTGTSPSPGPLLLANPHLAHLEASSSSQPQLSQVTTQGPGPQLPATSGSYHSLSGSQGQTNTLPSRGTQGSSGLLQSHRGMAGSSASHSSLGRPAGSNSGVYPVTSFGVQSPVSGHHSTSQDSLERQLAILTQNINNSNNNVVDVFVEP